jgi:hypothetical protein
MRDIRPMRAEDMMYVIENGILETQPYANKTIQELAESRAKGISFAGFVNDECVGVGGIDVLWEGVGEAWIILSKKVLMYPVSTYAAIIDGLRDIIKDNTFFRVQAWVRSDFAKAQRMARHLGFKAEGVARKYTPDKIDCILYSIIKEA